MPFWYINPSIAAAAESDAFDGGFGVGKLRDSWADVTWTAGDSYRQACGTEFVGRVTVGASGTQAAPIYIGAYGTGVKPKIVGGTSDTAGMRVSSRSRVTIEDLDISCPTTSSSGNGIEGFFSSSSEGVGFVVRRCDIHDCKNVGLALFTITVGAGAAVRSLLVEGCTFTDNGFHGSTVYGAVQGAKFVSCVYVGNGHTVAGHGASSFAHRNTYTNTGWTLVSGTTYKRAVAAPSGTTGIPTDVYQATYNKSPSWHLTKNTSTPTAPGSNEFGFSAGEIYVNVGEAPASGREIKAAVEIATGIQYFFCEFRETSNFAGGEGSGSQADDFSTVQWIGCESADNGGSGLFVNLGGGCSAIGCILRDNAESGFGSAAAVSNAANNNTILRNAIGVNFTLGSDSGSAQKNIIEENAIGVFADADSGSLSIDYNCLTGNGDDYDGASAGGNDVAVDPQSRDDFMPLAEAVRNLDPAPSGLDFYGKEFHGTIGAVQYKTARGIVARSLTTRTVTARTVRQRAAVTA